MHVRERSLPGALCYLNPLLNLCLISPEIHSLGKHSAHFPFVFLLCGREHTHAGISESTVKLMRLSD